MSSPITVQELKAGLNVLMILADAIRALGSVPNGVFYARISDLISLENYNKAIAFLQESKLIKVENNVITWVG